MSYTFKLRRDVAADWTTKNPILSSGEPGIETDTNRFKLGDGVAAWAELPYFIDSVGVTALVESLLIEGGGGGPHTHPESDITSLTADLATKAPLASPTFTGTATMANATVSGRLRMDYDALTDANPIVVDSSLGNRFAVTLTASGHVLGNPSNAVHGQSYFLQIKQDATGGRTMTLGTKFNDPNGYYTGVATAPNARSYLGYVYDSPDDQFDVLAFAAGY